MLVFFRIAFFFLSQSCAHIQIRFYWISFPMLHDTSCVVWFSIEFFLVLWHFVCVNHVAFHQPHLWSIRNTAIRIIHIFILVDCFLVNFSFIQFLFRFHITSNILIHRNFCGLLDVRAAILVTASFFINLNRFCHFIKLQNWEKTKLEIQFFPSSFRLCIYLSGFPLLWSKFSHNKQWQSTFNGHDTYQKKRYKDAEKSK